METHELVEVRVDLRQLNDSASTKISFVIPARNEERYVGACIDSLRSQLSNCESEIILIDNGSSDRTALVAVKHGARIVFEAQPGLAHARQAGLNAARGEFLVYVDADTRLPAHWTRDVIDLFDADSDLVAISSDFTFHDGRWIDDLGNVLFRAMLSPVTNLLLRTSGRPEVLIGSAIAVRTEALRRVNGVDLDFQFYGEDTMLACRIHSQGAVRFVRRPRYQTSARRYQERGLLSVVFRYFAIFALIHAGRIEAASRLADSFRAQDRKRQSREGLEAIARPSYGARTISGDVRVGSNDVMSDIPGMAVEGQTLPL